MATVIDLSDVSEGQSSQSRSAQARQMILDGASNKEIYEATGLRPNSVSKLRKNVTSTGDASATVSPPSQRPGKASGDSTPAAGPHPGSVTEAQRDIREAWSGLWNLLADVWEDDEIGMNEREADRFAQPAARSLELMGHLDKTKYLAPGRAVAVGVSQAKPRVIRIMRQPMNRKRREQAPEETQFRRPPGFTSQSPAPPDVQQPTSGAGSIDNPITLGPLNESSPF